MNARAHCALVAAGALAIVGSVLAASSDDPKKGPKAGRGVVVTRTLPGPGGVKAVRASAAIAGAAWYADNTPIPHARLRLREVVSGRLHAHTVANELGQFAFQSVEPSSYVVELVTETGKVLTVGQTFSVAPGETVATFVRLGTKVPWFNGFFANAAAAVSSTAAAAGVTAIAPEERPCASPPCRSGGSQ